jgi:hypothetical protein
MCEIPFLRRHDPDQVQGFGNRHLSAQAHPSDARTMARSPASVNACRNHGSAAIHRILSSLLGFAPYEWRSTMRDDIMRAMLFVALLILGGCASAPSQISNACAIFEQRNGWVNNWQRSANAVEREFGVPVPILMATIYSSFRPRARPPRTKLMGIIPWKRQSTAYGYSQALDGTWARYRRETGRSGARRTNFSDAIHFVGWYHSTSHRVNGIARNDAYNLYLAYYSGHAGYSRGNWRGNAQVQRAATRTANIAQSYASQLQRCR